ncbi:MAG: hypothetical protein GX067_04970 [Clostridiales bacterium]|nr:hypothetical protein [Clostridiales bacterium]
MKTKLNVADKPLQTLAGQKRAPEKAAGGIGTLGERTLHAALKRHFEPDATYHEIRYKGYVADIMRGDEIIEIQTRALNVMRTKLTVFLADNKVTVVHPVVREKWLNWVNSGTGEIVRRRKSPKRGAPLDAFAELYKIKMFLRDPNLTICLLPVDVEEYRRLDGGGKSPRKGWTRAEQIPTAVGEPVYLNDAFDYAALLSGLPDEFTSAEVAKAKKLSIGMAQTVLNVMSHVEAVCCIGKRGRCKLYKIRTTGESDI